MANPVFQVNPILTPTTAFLYALDEVFYIREGVAPIGCVIWNRTSGFSLPVTQSVDDLVTLAGLELVKFTHRESGQEIAVNRSHVSRVKQNDAGLATIVMDTEVSFPALDTYVTLRPFFEALPSGGGGINTNIYNTDGSIIDPVRIVTVAGNDLQFTTTGSGTVEIGISAGARLVIDPANAQVIAYGVDVEVDSNTKGVILKSTGGTRFRFRPDEIGVWVSEAV